MLFEQKCASCHTIGGGDRVGPDLRGIAERRPREWLLGFITAPDKMIAANDPVAVELLARFNRIAMPNLGLAEGEALALLDYIGAAGATAAPPAAPSPVRALPQPRLGPLQLNVITVFLVMTAVIVLVFGWVGLSTRAPAEVDTAKAYAVRGVFFVAAVLAVVALLVATLPNVPYAAAGAKADRVVYVTTRQFDFVFSDEPITSTEDLGRVPRIEPLELPRGALVEFRVTSLDVNHGFGVYNPQRQLVAQTQAMPGYVNRLFVRLVEPGHYKVFCLEYCAAGHHLMQSGLTAK